MVRFTVSKFGLWSTRVFIPSGEGGEIWQFFAENFAEFFPRKANRSRTTVPSSADKVISVHFIEFQNEL